jgi:hypothetical protein
MKHLLEELNIKDLIAGYVGRRIKTKQCTARK